MLVWNLDQTETVKRRSLDECCGVIYLSYLVQSSQHEMSGESSHSRGLHGRVSPLRGPRLHPVHEARPPSVAVPVDVVYISMLALEAS